jgi:hypothetical protein
MPLRGNLRAPQTTARAWHGVFRTLAQAQEAGCGREGAERKAQHARSSRPGEAWSPGLRAFFSVGGPCCGGGPFLLLRLSRVLSSVRLWLAQMLPIGLGGPLSAVQF